MNISDKLAEVFVESTGENLYLVENPEAKVSNFIDSLGFYYLVLEIENEFSITDLQCQVEGKLNGSVKDFINTLEAVVRSTVK